jgi:hypothetical protein
MAEDQVEQPGDKQFQDNTEAMQASVRSATLKRMATNWEKVDMEKYNSLNQRKDEYIEAIMY